ncbi:esterase EstP [Pseudomonas sp. MUP55]|uniref:esterase EstP n=1 Tax=Pseudomonas sp. MUP55 TaxID=3087234 RepID=UPI002A5AE078|nr:MULTISPECIES: esterase EstP [unclassified Pseudomonas]WPN92266.1 esterase EstP [Pseudomonas sp. MUP56]WPN97791.1 esterase EstP [Pseudomonas sp. MUP55]
MLKTSYFTPLAGCLLALACSQALAAPSPYSTMIVFGDSLADAGTFADPGAPGSTYRFTNRTGPRYFDGSGESTSLISSTLLGNKLGVAPGDLNASTSPARAAQGQADGSNWAVGGYTTAQVLDSITGNSTVTNADTGDVLRTRPGYLAATGGRADPTALYFLSGGGNDFLDGLVLDAPSSAAAAGRLADSAQALQQAGARYVMVWMLPNLGLTPAVNGTPLQGPTTALSNVFNQTLVQRLSQIDAQIIPLNIPLLLNEAFADPGRFGFATNQNLNQTCFSAAACRNPVYGVGGTNPDPTKLIYNDTVHPTEAGQRLIADYAYSLLAAPWEITLLPEMAQGTLRAHQDELRNQWQADSGNWQAVGQWRAIVAAGGQRLDFDDQNSSASGDGSGYNLNIGGSYRLNEAWRVGVAAGLYRQTLEAGASDSDYKLNSYMGTAFAQYQQNHWWADAALTGGKLDFDNLKRKFALGVSEGSEKGDTDGWLWALSGRVGYDIAAPGSDWHLSPFISADYARVEVNGYSEKDNRSTALTFDDQQRDSKRLGVGLQGSYRITPQTQVFGEVAHEHEFENDTQKVKLSLNSVPGLDFKLDGYTPRSNSDRLSLGVSHKLTQELALRAAYNVRKDDNLTQQGVSVGVSLDF